MILRLAIFVALLSLAIEAQKQLQTSEEQEQWAEFEEFLEWKKSKRIDQDRSYDKKYKKQYYENRNTDKVYESNEQIVNANPPPIDQAALMARYIVNQAGKKNTSMVNFSFSIEIMGNIIVLLNTKHLKRFQTK